MDTTVVSMSPKVMVYLQELTKGKPVSEQVSVEALFHFVYSEGWKDGYARGYMESKFSERSSNDH